LIWSTALALLVLTCALPAADRERPRPADKHNLLRGTIEEVASDNQIVVRGLDGKEWKLSVDDRSDLRLDGRSARLSDFKKGTRVRVRYDNRDGKPHVVLMRTPVVAKVVGEEGRDFLNSLKGFGYDKRDEYQRKLADLVARLDERIEDLNDRIADAGADAERRLAPEKKELERKRAAVREKMEQLKSVGSTTWEDLKGQLDRSIGDLQQTLDRAREKLK
jgi:gas vesicle protein